MIIKKFILFLLVILSTGTIRAQQTDAERDQKMQWWREARFGMFIHWGPYAILGAEYKGFVTGTSAWIMNRSKIPVAEYQQITRTFDPYKYDPEMWVLLAKEAGMKYIVYTAKHHDGFAMFKSDASEYNIIDFTYYPKDIFDELAKACRKRDMKLGFYYSQSQDWNNPGGTAHRRLIRQGSWANPDSVAVDAYTALHRGYWDPVQETRTTDEYFDQVAVPQVKELLSNYGDIAVIFWDIPSYMTKEQAGKLLLETDSKAASARLMHNNKKLRMKNTDDGIEIDVPMDAPDDVTSVVVIDLKELLPYPRPTKRVEETFDILDMIH